MVHRQAYDGTRRLRRACLRKEERNKWGFLPAPLKADSGRQAWKEVRLEGGNRLCRSSLPAHSGISLDLQQ